MERMARYHRQFNFNLINSMQAKDSIQIAIMYVRACGPVTSAEIQGELLRQCVETHTAADAKRQASNAIKHGLERGWLERYDNESFDIAAN
jgi:hypothetical protein